MSPPKKFDSRKYLYSSVVFLVSLFVLCSFQYTDLSNPLLKSFDSFLLSFADKVTTETKHIIKHITNHVNYQAQIKQNLLSISVSIRLCH